MSADIMMNWMLHTGLDISILIALILVFRRPFGRMFGAGAAYSLWLLPLIRLFLPEIPITLPRPSWMASPTNTVTEIIEFSGVLPVTPGPVSDPINWQIPVLTLWIGVAFLWLAHQFLRQRQYLGAALRDSAPVSESVQHKLNETAELLNLKRCPQVRLASTNVGPLVTGVIDPIIILPDNFEAKFDDRQQFFALTHEMAHIKRHDLIAAFLTLVFRALNWPNPLVHLSAARFRADQEAACDAYVLKTVGGGQPTKQSYAETLIHSARLSRHAPQSIGSAATNPLCLTIHHPLKERLMTMKTTKTRSTLLSRVGVAAFLAAGLAVTAPITIASAQDAPKVETKMKKVLKMVENENGVETTKTFEITEENGVTTIYSIDEHGNKTVVEESELGELNMMGGDLDIMVMGDGEPGEKRIKIVTGDHMGHMSDGEAHKKHIKIMKNGKMHMMGDGEHSQIMVKRMHKGGDGTEVEVDSNVFIMNSGEHASAMVEAAQQLIDQAETMQGDKELSSKAKRKLEKARKALAEAKAALDEE